MFNKEQTVPDIIRKDLSVVFCGINPGLMSAATEHHFARPGNRFWKALHLSGFTPRLLIPSEQFELLGLGVGITNVVTRPSATASELTKEELMQGAQELTEKIIQYKPRFLVILGIDAYRKGFSRPKAKLGKQAEMIGSTKIWLLPNPSGLNAHYSITDFAELFTEVRNELKKI